MAELILPDLYRIQVPLSGNPLGWVNSYVITGGSRNLVIDTGLYRKECLDALQNGFREIGIDLNKTDFYITHLHADHYSLVSSLVEDTSRAYINRPDWEYMLAWNGWGNIVDYARQNDFPETEIQKAVANHPGLKYGPNEMPAMTPIDEGHTFTYGAYCFEAVSTPGHTIGHTCLYEREKKLLVSGDHILLDITPNITCWADHRNPLEEYLTSLDKIFGLPVAKVLPGHRRIFEDLKSRITELKAHHQKRNDEILSILSPGPQTAYATASKMTWDIDCKSWEQFPVAQKWFATGETISHLRYLQSLGEISRENADETFLFYKNK